MTGLNDELVYAITNFWKNITIFINILYELNLICFKRGNNNVMREIAGISKSSSS